MKRLKRYFITGFVVVVPVFLTIYVLVILFQFVDGILGRFLNIYLKKTLGFYIPGLGFLLFFIIIALTGFSAGRFFGRKIFPRLEKWFSGLPVINLIYPAFKQIVSFIAAQKELGFKKVVLVEYPSKGLWSLAFLTNDEFKKMSDLSGREMVSVFVPSSPNPLTGYVIFVAKEELKFSDIAVSDALKIIISCGVFKP